MTGRSERIEGKCVPTAIENVSAPAATYGTKSVTVTGKLVRQGTSDGISGKEVFVALKTSPPRTASSTTDPSGNFTVDLDTWGLTVGSYDFDVKFPGEEKEFEPASSAESIAINPAIMAVDGIAAENKIYDGKASATLNLTNAKLGGTVAGTNVDFERVTSGTFGDQNVGTQKPVTAPGLKLIGPDSGNYALTPPTLSASITPALLTVTGIIAEDKVSDGTTNATLETKYALWQGGMPGDDVDVVVTGATGTFADANPGSGKIVTVTDVTITGAAKDNYTLAPIAATANIKPAQTVSPQSVPDNNVVTAVKRVLRDPKVTVGVAQLIRGASSQGSAAATNTLAVNKALSSIADAFAGTDALKAKGEPSRGQLRVELYLDNTATGKREPLDAELARRLDIQLIDESFNLATSTRNQDKNAILFNQVEAGVVYIALPSEIAKGAEISDEYEVALPNENKFKPFRRAKRSASGPSGGAGSPPFIPPAAPLDGFRAIVLPGQETTARFFLAPPMARVRCFSCLEDDECAAGKQYIQSVGITAMQGEKSVKSQPTGTTGSAEFPLSPGWYTFTAPEEVTIDGCNYTLSSCSPVAAFLGAGQCCSDIYFCYKKRGNVIEVISQICFPEAGDPYEEVKENFPGMQYLLLREGDSTFSQQQTTTDGGPVRFRNLSAGTYLLFCQAPPTYGSQPVTPVLPEDGYLTLRVFAGQTSCVPVFVKFRTGTTAPAVLDGYVRDDTGQPNPGQLVQVLNDAGRLVAAGFTDANGVYKLQIYKASNVTIVVGTQQIAVSQSQIQAAMLRVGQAALPSPSAAMDRALQASELVGIGE